ncbi:hypothetical protein CCR97_08385 [Rhodoplanes elegans]|uniref:Uncharacterized protein n=1 Tax=Rhodoplanes elegans TaxID=29408 RepID=A0A327KSX7_9BRAD|nr:hypothetical protein [Rhodoplanes elegans]MBK5958135.1 hypothetical protein [Rhodoplanes elegans]MBK5958227.1 hypothetical protein [Rhodoplanes elegans]RAI40422.1 hypothetical protein CH338_06160 [Rhodoplanes elegans]
MTTVAHSPDFPRRARSRARKVTAAAHTIERSLRQRIEGALRVRVAAAKCRKVSKAVESDLTLDWALAEVERNGLRCAVTGIPFFKEVKRATNWDPYAPSIDRIVPARGYVQSNCRIVLASINAALSDWGEEVFADIAKAFLSRREGR